ncbi:MAG: RNA polymerase sigma factor [Acidimicrobiia bacterium]
MADPDLIGRAQRGDRAAVDLLLREHYDRIFAVCRRMTGNDADAADAAQEALIAVVKGLARFDGRSALSTWIYRVATNACLDEMRRRKRRPMAMAEDPAHEPTTTGPTFDTTLTDRMTIDAALELLSEEFRVPVVLRDLNGYDYSDIARTLDIPVGTVKSRIARGRAQLAVLLGNQVPPDGRRSERDD